MIDEPDLDAIRDRDVLGIVDRERGVRDADDDRAGLLAFGGYGNQRSGLGNLLLRDDLRQVEHPADAGLVVEDLFYSILVETHLDECRAEYSDHCRYDSGNGRVGFPPFALDAKSQCVRKGFITDVARYGRAVVASEIAIPHCYVGEVFAVAKLLSKYGERRWCSDAGSVIDVVSSRVFLVVSFEHPVLVSQRVVVRLQRVDDFRYPRQDLGKIECDE
ncbi:hypothetical protein X992_6268 [Burkholderia pseudomallei MSHR5492]|nr:hypothetical protein X948_6274 [Burkholderia pseudomallei MSHR5608]KGS50093.1 hypothetical protein X992_6268 [Burkholderia pseudomallei MSHR5492]KGS87083.1 hypothetical protein X947_6312 [Burkholderia pseudomallei MSHR7334]